MLDAVAVLGMCYAMGTIDVLVSVVSAYMQDGGMRSPYGSRAFKMTMEGLRGYKGMGERKKPPIEPWHVAAILQGWCPSGLSQLQFLQAKVILSWGCQLFSRAQDFAELQLCDVREVDGGLEVTVRYAKNDPRGLTRTAMLEATGGAMCSVGISKEYCAAVGLAQCAQGCTNVAGQPQRCSCCPDLFPTTLKSGGVRGVPITAASVTTRVKALFVGLAERRLMTKEDALLFSSKSLRCGGVSAVAAETV